MAAPRFSTPFDSGEPVGAGPGPTEAELRALIEELKNTNPGALAKGPPPRRERIPGMQATLAKVSPAAGTKASKPSAPGKERVPGMQAMVSKVSKAKQGTRIPGLGLVEDPEPDAETASMSPPPMRSKDPFSSAEVYPFGMKNRHLAALGATAASVVPGVGPLVGGALGGLGMYGLTTEDKDLDPTGAGLSAMTGGLGGALLGKVLPAAGQWAANTSLGKKAASLIPNLTNDAKVAAEMGQNLSGGAVGPGEALSSRVAAPGPTASPPRPDTAVLAGRPRSPTVVSGATSNGISLPPPPPRAGTAMLKPPPGSGMPQTQALNPAAGPGGGAFKSFEPPVFPQPEPVTQLDPGILGRMRGVQQPSFAPLQAPPIPEIPGEPLPFRARVGGGAQTSPARPPPPPMSGTPPMPVRAALPRGGAPAPPQGLDSGIGDAAISEIRAGGGLPRQAPSHPFFQSMPEPSLPDTFVRPSPAPLNTGSPLAPPPMRAPQSMGAPGSQMGGSGLLDRARAGDRTAQAALAALIPAGILGGAAVGSLLPGAEPGAAPAGPGSESPFAAPSPFASQRPGAEHLSPVEPSLPGFQLRPPPKRKRKSKKK